MKALGPHLEVVVNLSASRPQSPFWENATHKSGNKYLRVLQSYRHIAVFSRRPPHTLGPATALMVYRYFTELFRPTSHLAVELYRFLLMVVGRTSTNPIRRFAGLEGTIDYDDYISQVK